MPVFKRELAFNAAGPAVNTGDWWHLVLDTDSPGLYVEHTWEHTAAHAEAERAGGSERYGINDFLTLAQGKSAQPALIAALKGIFRDCAPN
jgi:hypothetical protein